MNNSRSNHPNRCGHRVFVRSAPEHVSRRGSEFAGLIASRASPGSSPTGWLGSSTSSPPRSVKKLRPPALCAQTITVSMVGVATPQSSAIPRITTNPNPTSSVMYRWWKSGTEDSSPPVPGRMGCVNPRYAGLVRIIVAVDVVSSPGSSPYAPRNHWWTPLALDKSSMSFLSLFSPAVAGYRALIAATTSSTSADIASQARSSGAFS